MSDLDENGHKRDSSLTHCEASMGDGECIHDACPQTRDGEPMKTGRTCPLPWHGNLDDD